MKVSIIILTKNGQDLIDNCLQRIYAQDTRHTYEVIAIDSGSDDATFEILKKYPVNLHSIAPSEFSHSSTRNLGARLATGEFLIYLSQDAVPAGVKWLDTLIQPLLEDETIAGVFGKQIPLPDSDPVNRFRMQWMYGDNYLVKDKDSDFKFIRESFSFSDVNSALRKDLVLRYPFNQDILFCEDVYLASKLLSLGYKIAYTPKAAVLHSHNYGILGAFRRYFDIAVAYKKIGILKKAQRIGREGRGYIWQEFKYLVKSGHILWVPYSFLCNSVKYLGFKSGVAESSIPIRIKKKISKYWY